MCRFLIVKQKEEFDARALLRQFASVCRKSRTPDGDWQGDGWGVCWLEQGRWRIYKSLSPIWQDEKGQERVPQTSLLVAHARSASFPGQTGVLNYNQPYIKGDVSFVFNGLLRKVRLAKPVEGEIGAQKIWTLTRQYLNSGKDLSSTLRETRELLHENAGSVRGLNIALVRNGKVAVLCDWSEDKDYFTLWYTKGNTAIVCSEPLSGYNPAKLSSTAYNLSPMSKGQIEVL